MAPANHENQLYLPSLLTGEGEGEGESKPLPPHLNPLPRRGEELFGIIFYIMAMGTPLFKASEGD